MEIFASITPGLEPVLARELENLTGGALRVMPGGVALDGDLITAAGLALWSRCAGRILVRIGEFPARSLQELQAQAQKLPWRDFAVPGQEVEVRATVRSRRIRRSDAAAHKVAVAAKDALRGPRRGKGSTAPLEVTLRIADDLATVSADVGGGLLHRRGYRKATAKAPIRENLAACILQAAEWHPEEALVDPLCGSGTFAIEAAWMALDRAPGLDRKLSVTQWPEFPQRLWKERIHEARSTTPPPSSLSLHARDRDAGAIKAAKANAERAGVAALLHFSTEDFGAPFPPLPGPGLVVMNPPYGSRVGANAQLSSLYRRLGQTLQAQFSGWRLACVCPERSLAGRLGNLEELTRFSNGGIKVSLWLGEIP